MKRVLVIDDDRLIRMMLRQVLENEGYEVIEASDGREGLHTLRKTNADLILTDIIMPEMEGIETIREIKELLPEIKIIAMSGGGRIGPVPYLEMARDLGADHSLKKPIDQSELIHVARKLLSSSGQQD